MSIFLPTDMIGITFNTTKRPIFSTQVTDTNSGDQARTSIQQRVRWYWKIVYEFVYKAPQGVDELFSFFASTNGGFGTFLYRDPTDNVTATGAGTFLPPGAGSPSDSYQFARVVSAPFPFVEMLTAGAFNSSFGSDTWQLFGDGSPIPSGQVTVSSTGRMTFNTGFAPAPGTILTWTGNYYFPVHFLGDPSGGMVGSKFMQYYWQHDVEIESDLQGIQPVTPVPGPGNTFIDSVPNVDTA